MPVTVINIFRIDINENFDTNLDLIKTFVVNEPVDSLAEFITNMEAVLNENFEIQVQEVTMIHELGFAINEIGEFIADLNEQEEDDSQSQDDDDEEDPGW